MAADAQVLHLGSSVRRERLHVFAATSEDRRPAAGRGSERVDLELNLVARSDLRNDHQANTDGRGRALRRTDFSKAYHTFGMEWSENYLYTYIDSRLQQVLYVGFDDRMGHSMWDFGQFGQRIENSSLLENPWNQTGQGNTPFDQNFYLILNVAVGSGNGWFLDRVGSKPWIDSDNMTLEFFNGISLLNSVVLLPFLITFQLKINGYQLGVKVRIVE